MSRRKDVANVKEFVPNTKEIHVGLYCDTPLDLEGGSCLQTNDAGTYSDVVAKTLKIICSKESYFKPFFFILFHRENFF